MNFIIILQTKEQKMAKKKKQGTAGGYNQNKQTRKNYLDSAFDYQRKETPAEKALRKQYQKDVKKKK